MRVAVIVFPGSNCDVDLLWAIEEIVGVQACYVSHQVESLVGFDAVFLPGGFSYGDYLRCGAIARFSKVISEVIRFAEEGKPVFGTCNGFQVLTEIGLLSGTLIKNDSLKFVCKTVALQVKNNQTMFTSEYQKDELIYLPIAHGEGNYYCDDQTLRELEENHQIVFTYAHKNPNGSKANIAGIVNQRGNVLGMMPHPERAVESLLGSQDGLRLFESVLKSNCKVGVK